MNGWTNRWVKQVLCIWLAAATELCVATTFTSVAFRSNKCLSLMLLEFSGGQLDSSVDLGWALSHVRSGLVLAGVTKVTRVTQFHSLCLLSSPRLAQACAPGDGWGIRVDENTQGPWGPAWNRHTTFSWPKQVIGQPGFKGWGNRFHFFSERGTVKS